MKELDDLIKLQSKVLQTELADPYMHGIVNGLLTDKSVLQDNQEVLFTKLGNKYIQVYEGRKS